MRLLIVEDKDSFRRLLVQALAGTDWDVKAVGHPQEGLEALEAGAFEVLVTDLRLPGFSGLELLRRAKRLQPGLRVLLMSAFGEPRDIVEAVHWGADDFLAKPFDLEAFLALLQRTAALAEAPPPDPREPWVAHSPIMQALEAGLARAASSEVPVLFWGEPGCGKARAARRLHALRRPMGPYLALRADTLGETGPPSRLLDTLRGGSLVLTDLELLPPDRFAGLEQAMATPQAREISWMGTCRSLETLVEPLRTRLGVLQFHVAPLSQRTEDVIPLFRALLAAKCRQQGRSVPLVDRPQERALLGRRWAGGVRELSWCIDHALQATAGPMLGPLPAPELLSATQLILPLPATGSLEERLQEIRRHAEAQILQRELDGQGSSLMELAARLGLSPRTLAQRLRDHGIPLDDAHGRT